MSLFILPRIEVLSVIVQEVTEQVVDVDFSFDPVRQLLHESHVSSRCKRRQSVLLPVVVEEVFDFADEVLVKRITVVEAREQSDPLRQVLVLAHLPQRLVVQQDLNELAHDEREVGHAKHHEESADQSLLRCHGTHVTEANRRQRRQRVIPHFDE